MDSFVVIIEDDDQEIVDFLNHQRIVFTQFVCDELII